MLLVISKIISEPILLYPQRHCENFNAAQTISKFFVNSAKMQLVKVAQRLKTIYGLITAPT